MFNVERPGHNREMQRRAQGNGSRISEGACSRLKALLLNPVDHEKASVEEAFNAVGEAT